MACRLNFLCRCTVIASTIAVSQLSANLLPIANAAETNLPRVSDATEPRAQDRMITTFIRRLVERQHISHHKIDDEISQRTFDKFLESLDAYKLYFTAADYAEFSRHRNTIDDELSRGDVGFSLTVYKRLLKRIEERMPLVHQIIDGQFDFNLEEEICVEPDVIQYAKNDAEMQDRWRKQIKYAFLALRADNKADDKIREQLHRRYRSIESYRRQEDMYELLELYLTAMTTSLDPHTTYMAPRSEEDFEILMSLGLQGIGATLSPEDGMVTIVSLVPGGAADKDGRLKVGDQITGVMQEGSSEEVDVVDMKLTDVVSLIRGPAGTKVVLRVQPKVGGETKMLDITRAQIELEDSAARSKVLEHVDANGRRLRVGYIKLPSFYLDMSGAKSGTSGYRSTTSDMKHILDDFRNQNVDVVLLDLAMNGGGSLTEAIDCTGLFIDKGPVVQVKDSEGKVTPYFDENPGVSWSGPLVVKTNKMSASASEIFAGAIKDYHRGLIVGDPQTHGKGTVQTVADISEMLFGAAAKESMGALKLTIQQFYLPDGRSTQREGVLADVTLPSLTANADIGESDLDYALPEDQVKPQRHIDYQMINANLVSQLNQAARGRITSSEDFDKLLRKIEAYKLQKDEQYKSLKESDFRARRKELDIEALEEKQEEEAELPSAKVFDDGYYNQEVLNITADYVDLLRQSNLAANQSSTR